MRRRSEEEEGVMMLLSDYHSLVDGGGHMERDGPRRIILVSRGGWYLLAG
jgi:hypothetical protein